MRKITLLMIMVFACLISISAQRKIVYVEPFTVANSVSVDIADGVRDCIYSRISKMGRVDLIDGEHQGINEAKKENADYLIRGTVSRVTVDLVTGKKENEDKFVTEIKGEIEMVDVKGGSTIGQKIIDGDGSCYIKLPTIPRTDRNYRKEVRRLEDEAHDKSIASAIDECDTFVADMIDNNIKIKVNIVGITEIKKEEVRGVIIDKGTMDGVSDGQRFIVSSIKDVNGYPVLTKIAEIRVKEQPTESAASCKVTSGKKDLKIALDTKVELSIVNRTAKLFDM